MKDRNWSRRWSLLLLLVCGLLLSACGGIGAPGKSIQSFIPEEDGGTLYFYGVEKSGGTYFARVLQEYQEEPQEFLYVPLAEELKASFQPEGWVGAWCPDDYWSAEELAEAARKGQITQGAKFQYGMADGLMNYLVEENYYAGLGVDLTTGEIIIPWDAVVQFSEEGKNDVFYFYGVTKSVGDYYIMALEEPKQDPEWEDYWYICLDPEVEAIFREEGAREFSTYESAEALAEADGKNRIPFGTPFSCVLAADGRAEYLKQR